MNHSELLASPEFPGQLLQSLKTQGLAPTNFQLIGLLGHGTNATVFSVMIDGMYHVLKIYKSRDKLRAELRHLRKATPPERLLFAWEEKVEGLNVNLVILEMPPGKQISSANLGTINDESLAEQLVDLHRLRYQQTVSVTALKRRLQQSRPALDQLEALGLERQTYEELYDGLRGLLDSQAELFRVKKSRIHGDLWWPNVISAASNDGVYLIDWEDVRRADPAEDLAKLRTHFWFSRDHYPSRNFFWRASNHGERVGNLMQTLISAHEAEFSEDLRTRLRLYLPLYSLMSLAYLATGESTIESGLQKPLYALLAEDALRLFDDPTAPTPDLAGTNYYRYIEHSRVLTV